MLSKYFFSIVVSVSFSYSVLASQSPWYFNKYSIEQGLPQSTATCILKDQLGFIWVGTQGGLSRFDGYQFSVFKYNKRPTSLGGNWVTDCAIDNQGVIWVTTATGGLSKFNAETETFTRFNTTNSDISDNKIWSIHVGMNGDLWLGTESAGLVKFDTSDNTVEHFSFAVERKDKALSMMIRDITQDNNGSIWLATSTGILRFDPKTKQFASMEQWLNEAIRNNYGKQLSAAVWSLAFDNTGRLWFGSKLGLGIISADHQHFSFLDTKSGDLGVLGHNWVISIFRDMTGNMWLGTYGGGISMFDANGDFVNKRAKSLENPNGLSSSHIMSFYQEDNQNIWVGTDGGGVNFFAKNRQNFNHQKHDSFSPNSISHSFVRALSQDSKGHLWIGTRNGLNRSKNTLHFSQDYQHIDFQRFSAKVDDVSALQVDNIFALHHDEHDVLWAATYGGGLSAFNSNSESFTHYKHDEKNPASLASNYVYSLASAGKDAIWVGTSHGLNLLNTQSGQVQRFQHQPNNPNSLTQNTIFTILQDSKNRVWIGTRDGLNLLSADHKTFTHFKEQVSNGLSSNMVISLLQSDENTLWVGTMQGLNKLDIDTGNITQFTEENGLLNGNIFSIQHDQQGFIWISTNRGMSRLDPKTNRFKHFQPEDGLQGNAFLLGSSFKNNQGFMMMGGVNGFNVFDPSAINQNNGNETVVLTDFLLENHSVSIGMSRKHGATKNKPPILSHAVSLTKDITLDHTQSIFSFEFSSLNYVKPKMQHFAYQLSGFDESWLTTDASKRIATYSNIPAGDYQLKVAPFNIETTERGSASVINLRILPAPWKTWWAYTLYTLALILLAAFITRLYFRKKEAEQHKQLALQVADAKDELLSNISHEFRTPLTLILGPLDQLIAKAEFRRDRQSLSLVKRNGIRLLTMVNQILDFREMHTKSSQIPALQDLNAITLFMCDSFQSIASERRITLNYVSKESEKAIVEMVPDGLEKVIGNLLSNAFKYSEPQSVITVTLVLESHHVELTITDTGSGMHQHDIERIFSRHHRAHDVDTSISGYGIGLSIVKELTEQHGGTIQVESQVNQGSTFKLRFPRTKVTDDIAISQTTYFNDDHYAYASATASTYLSVGEQISNLVSQDNKPNVSKPTALIIEDNAELSDYVADVLSSQFLCIQRPNGKAGLAAAIEVNPDIIVCDVMMPEMDGYELVKRLRAELSVSHIPVMLLTAKNDRESKLKGFEMLADDYLTKPFDETELQMRANRLITLRQIVQRTTAETLTLSPSSTNPALGNLSLKDKEFIESLQKVVQENFDQHEFSVERIATLMCMSPRTLQIKVKALTDMTPTDFLRLYRLKYAASLLKETTMTIGQVAEQSGFSSQSYFAKCFKAKYGCGAKEFRVENVC